MSCEASWQNASIYHINDLKDKKKLLKNRSVWICDIFGTLNKTVYYG